MYFVHKQTIKRMMIFKDKFSLQNAIRQMEWAMETDSFKAQIDKSCEVKTACSCKFDKLPVWKMELNTIINQLIYLSFFKCNSLPCDGISQVNFLVIFC